MRITFIRTSHAGLIWAILGDSIALFIAADRDHPCHSLLVKWIGFLCIAVALTGCTPTQEQTLIPTTTANQIISATALVTAEAELVGTSLSFTTVAQGEHLSANFYPDAPKVIIIANNDEIDTALRQATGDPPKLNGNPHPLDKLGDIDYALFCHPCKTRQAVLHWLWRGSATSRA